MWEGDKASSFSLFLNEAPELVCLSQFFKGLTVLGQIIEKFHVKDLIANLETFNKINVISRFLIAGFNIIKA